MSGNQFAAVRVASQGGRSGSPTPGGDAPGRNPRGAGFPAGLASILATLLLAGCASPGASSGSRSGSGASRATSTPTGSGGSQAVLRGKATYYGARYQGRLTANGERFDKNGITAAHESFPFGTRVRVTNLENGKSVVVRINDRFKPFKGRIIDLSEGAFARIAPLAQGVIPVSLQVVR
ncbi:MAG: septal ring lytic transglycosylase RlpA family protein [Verrucomicrobiae bacterium]|nr:septal ring lytic transglycosylase RlpA family protein [Verrucomicrobiae bacterium]